MKIITYKPKYRKHFVRLNKAWLEEYFTVESHDIVVFENIEKAILEPGGEIFFAVKNDEIVGTVALQPDDEDDIELSKMAVDKAHQGLGIANELMVEAIGYAIENNYKRIFLLSNRKLGKALNLYKKFGFKNRQLESTDYNRADIQMELNVEGAQIQDVIPQEVYENHQ